MVMDYDYHINLKLNKRKIILHMENHRNGKKEFDATLTLSAFFLKAAPIKTLLRRHALSTYKVAVAIYWQAFQLWLKRVPFHSHLKTDKRK